MKKITGLLLAAVLCMPAYAAQTKNTMKMVSYFPVPYVAYDTVSANNAMDIGVLNQCAMDIKKGSSNLGGSACSLYLYGNANGADLNRGLLNVTGGKLDLNSTVNNARIVSKKVQIGENMTTQGGWLDIGIPAGKNDSYDALYLSSIANTGNSFRVTSKEDGATVNSFHMFNEISNDFPGCAGTVTWQELELGADVDTNTTYTDVYLVCNGTGEVTPPQDCQAPNGQTYTESCPNGQTGTITYTWQGEPTCSYKETNNCATIPDGKDEEICENEPDLKTKMVLCSDELGENYTGRITYSWDSEACDWKETSRTCKYEPQKKRYLSHPYKCERLCERSMGAAGIQPCSAPSNKPLMPARCALLGIMREYLYNDRHYGIGLPAGCSAGKECPSCEVGKSYVNLNEVWCSSLGYDGNYGNSSFYSMEILQCMESTTPPGAGNLDCSNFRSPGGGGEIIIPNPGR